MTWHQRDKLEKIAKMIWHQQDQREKIAKMTRHQRNQQEKIAKMTWPQRDKQKKRQNDVTSTGPYEKIYQKLPKRDKREKKLSKNMQSIGENYNTATHLSNKTKVFFVFSLSYVGISTSLE